MSLRSSAPIGLVLVDLNAMKRVNETAGHVAGDRALAATGQLLRRTARATDIVGRYGGDEFAVLLPDTDAEGVAVVARRIEAAFDDLKIEVAGGFLKIGASVGAAVLTPGQPPEWPVLGFDNLLEPTKRTLVEAADAVLYDVKRGNVSTPYVRTIRWTPTPTTSEPASHNVSLVV